MRALSPLALFVAACSCPRPGPGPGPHYAGFGELTHAVIQGDLPSVAARAEALDGGGAVRLVSPAGQRAELDLHGAAGFLMVAMDATEAGEGLAAAVRACGACHAAEGVRYTGTSAATPQSHGQRFDAALRALESGDPAWAEVAIEGVEDLRFPEAGPEVAVQVEALRARLASLDGRGVERLEAVVGVVYGGCASCHGVGVEPG
jgi:cytochrome c553